MADGKPGIATKLTPLAEELILRAIHIGLPLPKAAALAEVSSASILNWLKRGEAWEQMGAPEDSPEALYGLFRRKFYQAEAGGMMENLQKIKNAKEWQAAAWILERRYPQDFGKYVERSQEGEGNQGKLELQWPETPAIEAGRPKKDPITIVKPVDIIEGEEVSQEEDGVE